MINELLKEREIEEENKIMEAIHNQARWNRLEREHSVMMKKIDKELKNKKTSKIKEVLINGIADTLLLVISLAGITAWGLVFYLFS